GYFQHTVVELDGGEQIVLQIVILVSFCVTEENTFALPNSCVTEQSCNPIAKDKSRQSQG
ncbi:unnamed protein product, partial [Bubo scandiacus]